MVLTHSFGIQGAFGYWVQPVGDGSTGYIQPVRMAVVGERSNNSKFSTHHQDQSMEILATREREREDEHLHTFEDR